LQDETACFVSQGYHDEWHGVCHASNFVSASVVLLKDISFMKNDPITNCNWSSH